MTKYEKKLQGFLELEDNWCYPGSVRITHMAVESARKILEVCEFLDLDAFPAPMEDGGVSIEYSEDKNSKLAFEMIFDINPDGQTVSFGIFKNDELLYPEGSTTVDETIKLIYYLKESYGKTTTC